MDNLTITQLFQLTVCIGVNSSWALECKRKIIKDWDWGERINLGTINSTPMWFVKPLEIVQGRAYPIGAPVWALRHLRVILDCLCLSPSCASAISSQLTDTATARHGSCTGVPAVRVEFMNRVTSSCFDLVKSQVLWVFETGTNKWNIGLVPAASPSSITLHFNKNKESICRGSCHWFP